MVRAVVDEGLSKAEAARRYNTTPKTVAKWVERYRKEGVKGLRDRSSRPHCSPSQAPQATCAAVEALRRQRHTGEQIAKQLAISPATVSRILRRLGLNRLGALEPAEPVRRYEREKPGELIHIDIKKLGKFNQFGHRITGDRTGQSNSRGVGWEFVHVCIDDHSRIGFADVMPDQKKRSAIAFLKAAVAYYASIGVKVERVMTDNGSCYKSFAFRRACQRVGLRHIAPSPTRPRPTARWSASFKPACGSGPMPTPTKTLASENNSYRPGCIATIGIDRMPASAIKHRSADSVSPRTTS
jgi:transposase